jgi:gliding motility-associated-like protein
MQLTIYNRYGQKVFETTDPLKGWNGFYNGKLQDTGSFAWNCSYQFAGEKLKAQKGFVVLIR